MARRSNTLVQTLFAALFSAALAATAFAQEGMTPRPMRSVTATGEATVTATPDQAQMTVAVVTQAPTADQAAADNARKSEAVIAAVRAALEPGAEVKTVGYTIAPNYVYPPQGGEPKLNGYNVTNSVLVKTGDLKRVGPAIDAAVGAGANSIQGLQFTLKNDAATQAEALRQASRNAMARATAIAEGLGVRTTGVLRAEEGNAVVRPVFREAMDVRTASAQTPVEPGSVEVHATVTLTVGVE
jgi:uncharacterized protein YggE